MGSGFWGFCGVVGVMVSVIGFFCRYAKDCCMGGAKGGAVGGTGCGVCATGSDTCGVSCSMVSVFSGMTWFSSVLGWGGGVVFS